MLAGHRPGRHAEAHRGPVELGDIREGERRHRHQVPGAAGFQHVLIDAHADTDADTVEVADAHTHAHAHAIPVSL